MALRAAVTSCRAPFGLKNWDAERVAERVSKGTVVAFMGGK